MNKEIIITNANNQEKFICFRLNGLKDGIMVGLYPNNDGLSIAYKGDVVGVPFNADSALIDELNDNSFLSELDNHDIIDPKLSGPVNATSYPLKTEWEIKADDKITTTLTMNKETYDWLTTPSEEDDDVGYYPACCTELDNEAYEAFEKDVMNPEIDEEKVETAKQIFEGVDKIPVDISSCIEMYGKPHLLELMDEWGINGSNYNDFRSVIQEHCFDKGLYAFDDIEKTWKSHVQSLKDVVKSIKEGIK